MSTVVAETLSPRDLRQFAEAFFCDGCVVIPGVLSAAETAVLRDKTDSYAASLDIDAKHISHVDNTLVLRRCEELDPVFAALTTHPAVITIAEEMLGESARFNAMNIIRNGPGEAIARWHVDDVLELPLPPDIPRFDARMRMPVFWMTVQIALTDIDCVEHGPTQYVPGSHYSGRYPISQDNPEFEGRSAEDVLCKAGDVYLTNHQAWHRGAPNLSDRTRYIVQLQYAQRWADARFKGLA